MRICNLPDWFFKTKRIKSNNCMEIYGEKLSAKLGIEKYKLLSFEECRKQVRKHKFKNLKEYQKNRKPNWPYNPRAYYKEYTSSENFLGLPENNLLSFKECRNEVRKCKFTSLRQYCKKRKLNWPSNPSVYYDGEWIDSNDFLGKQVLSFEKCRIEARKLKLKSKRQYEQNRKPTWPGKPSQYFGKKWTNWYDFLGTEALLSFRECRKEVRKHKLKTITQYRKNRKLSWPSAPKQSYSDEWAGWDDFLGR